MLTSETFQFEVEAFLERSQMTATAFGRAAVGDPNLVADLRAGRQPSLKMVGRVFKFISEWTPEKVSA
jgi:2,4-dienoyl-CoA reductase-like NADH-dependent reductase (Old Yellow Enzyme family)